MQVTLVLPTCCTQLEVESRRTVAEWSLIHPDNLRKTGRPWSWPKRLQMVTNRVLSANLRYHVQNTFESSERFRRLGTSRKSVAVALKLTA
jgi:hypothetical protein